MQLYTFVKAVNSSFTVTHGDEQVFNRQFDHILIDRAHIITSGGVGR